MMLDRHSHPNEREYQQLVSPPLGMSAAFIRYAVTRRYDGTYLAWSQGQSAMSVRPTTLPSLDRSWMSYLLCHLGRHGRVQGMQCVVPRSVYARSSGNRGTKEIQPSWPEQRDHRGDSILSGILGVQFHHRTRYPVEKHTTDYFDVVSSPYSTYIRDKSTKYLRESKLFRLVQKSTVWQKTNHHVEVRYACGLVLDQPYTVRDIINNPPVHSFCKT